MLIPISRSAFVSLLCMALVLVSHNAASQTRKLNVEQMLNSGSMGTEFWIAIPPNELNPYPVEQLDIYLASAVDTDVEIYDAGNDKTIRRTLKANEVRTLTDAKQETSWTWEVREPEQVITKGIRIRSTNPISVCVLNSKTASTDGYMALPTSSWDKEYIAASYYDCNEFKKWPGGFLVVAKEPTDVTILLRGTGKDVGKTLMGRSIGEKITVWMDAGDVYMVLGNGQTRGEFDLTGTSIVATKPVGVIGCHMRTTMPNLLVNGNGRNHLVEMLPPVSAWDTLYQTIDLQRESRNNQGKGDVFRVIAKEANTRWTLSYYDKTSKKLLGRGGGLLKNAGEFADLTQSGSPTTLTHGFSVWTADKPILVVQYSCSSSWDGDQQLDPFMIVVPAHRNQTSSSMFQVPTSSKFTQHRLHLVVTTDSTDPKLIDNLKSLTLDGVPVWDHPDAQGSKLLDNKMPGGGYWTSITIPVGTTGHVLNSNGKVMFSGYVYGYGSIDAYGWSITGAQLSPRIVPKDTLPPVLTRLPQTSCTRRTYRATEERNIPNPPRANPLATDQVDRGIKEILLLSSSQINLRLELGPDSATAFANLPKNFTFSVSVIDTTKAAYGDIQVWDANNNGWADWFAYVPGTRVDTLKPVIEAKSNVGVLWDFEIRDNTNIPDPPPFCPDSVTQVDAGLKSVQFDSLNMRMIRPLQRVFPAGTYTSSMTFEVIDITKAGWGCVTVFDNAGNSRNFCQQYNPSTSVENHDQQQPTTMSYAEDQLIVNASSLASTSTVRIYSVDGRLVSTQDLAAHSTLHVPLELTRGAYLAIHDTHGNLRSTISFVIP